MKDVNLRMSEASRGDDSDGSSQKLTRRSMRLKVGVATGVILALGTGLGLAAASSTAPPGSDQYSAVANNPSAQAQLGTNAAGVESQLKKVAGAFEQSAQSQTVKPTYSASQRATIYANQLKLANCMRADGYSTFPMPNPNFGDGQTPPLIIGGPEGGNIDVSSSAVQSAMAACSIGMPAVPGS